MKNKRLYLKNHKVTQQGILQFMKELKEEQAKNKTLCLIEEHF
jgi:hypothetical protein